jgi:hypothetical protein
MVAPTEDLPPVAVESTDSAHGRPPLDARTVFRLALLFTLLPLVISGVTMWITVGNS